MDVEQLENGTFSNETVALLILNELRMMRRDMNAGMMRLEAKVDFLYQNRKDMDQFSTDSENVVMVPVDFNTENTSEPPITRIFAGSRKAHTTESSETKPNSETQQDNEEDDIPEYTVHVDVNDLPEDVDEEQLCGEDQVLEEYNTESFEIDEKNDPAYEEHKSTTEDTSAINGVVQTDDGRYPCDLCSNSYSSRGNLQRHRRFHTGDKRYQCSVCARQFFRNEYLLRHMKKHTDGPRKRRVKKLLTDADASEEAKKIRESLTCEVCHRTFTLPNNLKRHMRIHTGEKPYACDLCGQKFARDDFMKSHMRKVHNY